MSRIKGRYVAMVEIDFDVERKPGMISIEEIQEKYRRNMFTEMVRQTLADGFEFGTVKVIQQYADVYEEDEV